MKRKKKPTGKVNKHKQFTKHTYKYRHIYCTEINKKMC